MLQCNISRKFIFFFVLCVSFANIAHAELRDLPQLTVLSTPSLSNVLTQVARDYSAKNTITVTTSFEADGEQVDRIKEGSPADIIITSHPQWMSELKQRGLVDIYSIDNLMQNNLCLTASTNSAVSRYSIDLDAPLEKKIKFILDRAFIVIGDPVYSSLGVYTLQALSAIKMEEKVLSRAIRAGGAENAYLIAKGQHAGIIFCSDLRSNAELMNLGVFPNEIYEPVIYQIAVVAGENMELAREFIDYLKLPETQIIFKNQGFVVK